VEVLGFDNLKSADEIKKRIGVQLQSSQYLHHLSLGELLDLFASLYPVVPSRASLNASEGESRDLLNQADTKIDPSTRRMHSSVGMEHYGRDDTKNKLLQTRRARGQN